MKINLGNNWNLLRLLRLVIGLATTVQGFMLKEFAFSIGGFFLVYMAIADVGCAGGKGCKVELKDVKQTNKENENEEVGS